MTARAADRRKRARAFYFKTYNRARGRRASKDERDGKRLVIGIDGEGYTLPDGSHRYVYMAASTPEGCIAELRNPKGLTASEVFAWLLKLPKKALLVGFALGYDRTKWLESWPDERVWRLVEPDRRPGKNGPLPVDCDGWRVNLVSTKLTVRRKDDPDDARTVWDVWKFFQSSFVKALARWDVGTELERRFVARQKARRGNFRGIGRREERYCQKETQLLATLFTLLVETHAQNGVNLRHFFGPGSSAAVVLEEMGADLQRSRFPDRMGVAVLSAYFGGRFECSRVGPVKARRLYAYDIASAYSHAFTRIPCLHRHHGTWVRRKGASLKGRHPIATLVRYEVRPHARACPAWGPLPHRTPKGDILFALQAGAGWAWREEFEAGTKLHPGVTALETWTWKPTCDCAPPYEARVRELYALRKKLGKGRAGIVIKLLLNSLYGKSAQRAGKGRFRCMVRAGLVTSITRAKLLRAVLLAKNPWDVLELATDSVLSRVPLPGIRAVAKDPALGAWEEKEWKGGAFLMRPGMRFSIERQGGKLAPTIDKTAARGVAGKTLHKNRARILRHWARTPYEPITLRTPSFFHGAKLSVRGVKKDEHGRPTEYKRDPLYGRWTDETRTIKFGSKPKRESILPDGRLEPWRLPRGKGCESTPYGVAEQSAIGDELERMRELEDDQPDHAGVAMV